MHTHSSQTPHSHTYTHTEREKEEKREERKIKEEEREKVLKVLPKLGGAIVKLWKPSSNLELGKPSPNFCMCINIM